jgi:uncharacterized protein (DUF2062 family)
MTGNARILVVVPAYNNRSTLAAVAGSALATGYDLLVIDDGSDDDSLRTIADLPCRTIRFEHQRGEATALLHGAELAARHGYDAIVAIAGDGRHNPADIPLLAVAAENHPTPCLVIGACPLSHDAVPRSGRSGNSLTSFLVRLESGLELPDVQSSFRLYPVKELLALNLAPESSGFAVLTIVKLAWSGVQVISVPVSCHPGDQPIGPAQTMKDAIRLHSRLVARRLLPWPHRKLVEQEPFREKFHQSFSGNPLKVLGKICREHSSPLWLAMAVWLGIFMGALPLLAIHTIAILYVAHRLHLNKVAAVAASQFCMPPVVPVLCIQMGYYLRNGELLFDFSWQRWLLEIHQRFWEWLIGSLLIGPLLGLIGAGVMYWMASRLQNHRKIRPSA